MEADRLEATDATKSAASLEITPASPRLKRLRPTPNLNEAERNLFVTIPRNLQPRSLPAVGFTVALSLCGSLDLAERAAEQLREAPVVDGKPSPWLVVHEKFGANPYGAQHIIFIIELPPANTKPAKVCPCLDRERVPFGARLWAQSQPHEDDDDDASADQQR